MTTTWCKTAGVPTFPPHRDPLGPCALRELCGEEPWREAVDWPEGFAGGIAHRLDVPTSGALWVADDVDELARMRRWFSEGRLRKTYVFEAAGDVPWDRHEVDRPIAHDRKRRSRMTVQRGRNTPHRGRWYPAHTEFLRIEGRFWRAVITTGVTHQIRVHAGFVGLALRGDRLYGGGAPITEAVPFHLHHVGLVGPEGGTDPIPAPSWLPPHLARAEVLRSPPVPGS